MSQLLSPLRTSTRPLCAAILIQDVVDHPDLGRDANDGVAEAAALRSEEAAKKEAQPSWFKLCGKACIAFVCHCMGAYCSC